MDDTVTITRREYEDLKQDSGFLNCLRLCGVDNWDGGYGDAVRMWHNGEDE